MNEDRVASCYLYDDMEVMPGEELGALFKSRKIRTPINGSTPEAT